MEITVRACVRLLPARAGELPARVKIADHSRLQDEQIMNTPRSAALGLVPLLFVTAVSAQTATVKAYTGFTLIDGTDRPPVTNAALVVRDGRVVAAGPAANVTIPAGAQRIALNGKTVVPGLINSHGHVNDSTRDLRTYAAYGVTT